MFEVVNTSRKPDSLSTVGTILGSCITSVVILSCLGSVAALRSRAPEGAAEIALYTVVLMGIPGFVIIAGAVILLRTISRWWPSVWVRRGLLAVAVVACSFLLRFLITALATAQYGSPVQDHALWAIVDGASVYVTRLFIGIRGRQTKNP
ncbi:hypothetical protein [Serinicoccus sp. LYQ131]|uniref:hypothetical protein n=1 Tax=Serinicoccus sp. LYQ131 TaxID=3378797 RepID=UPI0038549B8A